MSRSIEERKQLRRNCTHLLNGFAEPRPAQLFAQMAAWCETHDVDHDIYGDGALISDFENKVATLLGKPAAAFMPSGVMAQLAAVRIWTERQHTARFGLHVTSHLEVHEEQAYQALLGLHGVPVGQRERPIVADDLKAIAEPLGCLIVELPMRELGGQLPDWDALVALKAAAHARGTPLHMDGARLWESRAFYQRSYTEIAEGFDSVYVSVYKGIGGIAGALLVGDEAFIAQAKVWRRRMGGTLVHQSPMIVSAAMRFDERLALLPACYERTVRLAEGLNRIDGIRTEPRAPQANMLHIAFDADPVALLDARDEIAQQDHLWLIASARRTDVPGWSRTELYVGDTLVSMSDEQVMPLFERLIRLAKAR